MERRNVRQVTSMDDTPMHLLLAKDYTCPRWPASPMHRINQNTIKAEYNPYYYQYGRGERDMIWKNQSNPELPPLPPPPSHARLYGLGSYDVIDYIREPPTTLRQFRQQGYFRLSPPADENPQLAQQARMRPLLDRPGRVLPNIVGGVRRSDFYMFPVPPVSRPICAEPVYKHPGWCTSLYFGGAHPTRGIAG